MPLAIAAFRGLHPGVELCMADGRARGLGAAAASAGELDLALGFDSRIRAEVDGIARTHLISDPMFLVMPPTIRSRTSATCGWPTSPTTRGSPATPTASATG